MKILIAFLLLIPAISFSQSLPMQDGKVVYAQIDSVSGSQTDLYSKAKAWIINSFNGKKQKFTTDNKESGELISSGHAPLNFMVGQNGYPVTGMYYFTIQVNFKDNKTRIRFYNIKAKVGYNNPEPIEEFNQRGPVIDIDRKAIKEGVYKAVNDGMLMTLVSFRNAIATTSHTSF
jgi:hypothetical protein